MKLYREIGELRLAGLLLRIAFLCVTSFFAFTQANALEPIQVSAEKPAIDITQSIDRYLQQDDSLKVSTVPDADGVVRRIEVRSRSGREGTNWAVFALANTSNEQIDRLIVAPYYRLVASGLIWPDLDAKRILAITPSDGFSLEQIEDDEADVFRITLDPGSVVTFVAELNTNTLPKLYLWEPDAYKDTVNSFTLYRGIVLGIAGLLALFLTILFVVKGSALFPATAALAWSVLAYICVDFGFWNKIIQISVESAPVWRAGSEVFLAASALIFIYAYLNLNRWHTHFSSVAVGWMLGLVILFGVAIIKPSIASGIARISFAFAAIFGAAVIAWLALQRYDRAIMLIPTWFMVLAWTAAAWFTVNGVVSNDIVQSALAGGMVLIVMLLSFTVMQHAFAGGVLAQGLVSDVERQALALTGSSGIVWEWDVIRDQIHVDEAATQILALPPKSLNKTPADWNKVLHPNDRDRFRAVLDAILEHKRGQIKLPFRLRSSEGNYHWFELKSRPLLGSNGEVIRCVGTLNDITTDKNSEERLLHDAIHDNLTGLENRELFTNRLKTVVALAAKQPGIRPSLFHINLDDFKHINDRFGVSTGDTLLLTVARRLGRLLKEGDELSRFGSDQFVLMYLSESAPDKIAAMADSIRRALGAPIKFGDETIELTASIGIASWTNDLSDADRFLNDAELAMVQAKRFGGNRIEPFRPAFRTAVETARTMDEDLSKAIERDELDIYYQPIVDLSTRQTVGFEALARWQHPEQGQVPPSEFIAIAENSGLILTLGKYLLEKTVRDFSKALQVMNRRDLYVAINISSTELLRHDFVADIAHAMSEHKLESDQLRVELTESLVMRNPEYSSEVLGRLKALGIKLALDDFGTGYSSLSYLLKFPFDTIKIDREFMQAGNLEERSILLRSIVALGHGLGQTLIAEGVESETDAAELLQLNCGYGQGYLFGEPVPVDDIDSVVEAYYEAAGQ